ncbi:MAG: response regulator [Saprospiraceae bacterium]
MLLIIEDDIAVSTSLKLLLSKEGIESMITENPEDALTVIKKQHIELVLLDMNFSNETSGKDGLDLLQKIKTINKDLPVILITGWATIDLAVRGMKMVPLILSTNPGKIFI